MKRYTFMAGLHGYDEEDPKGEYVKLSDVERKVIPLRKVEEG